MVISLVIVIGLIQVSPNWTISSGGCNFWTALAQVA